MRVPRCWKRVEERVADGQGGSLPLAAWGSGDDEAAAEADGRERLSRAAALMAAGNQPGHWYGYPDRPVREEILQTFEDAPGDASTQMAVVTRNGYGAVILNTARMLFLDVDIESGMRETIRGWFWKTTPEQKRLEQLQHVLAGRGEMGFRIYRTAAGFRVIGLGREFDPAGRDAEDLMLATGTDEQFRRLCRVQRCFRARLTPKPWRCGVPRPWIRYPYLNATAEQEMRKWIEKYERQAAHYATCRLVAEIGTGAAEGDQSLLLELHDGITKASSSLPLA